MHKMYHESHCIFSCDIENERQMQLLWLLVKKTTTLAMYRCTQFVHTSISMEIHSVDENINKTKQKTSAVAAYTACSFFICLSVVFLIDYGHLIKLYTIHGNGNDNYNDSDSGSENRNVIRMHNSTIVWVWFEYLCELVNFCLNGIAFSPS